MSEPGAPVAPRDNPYFGLEYFDERFGAWFFGREAEGSKVITNLRAARLTLLHAESGVGKSSLLRAGVAWRMRRHADDMFARRRAVRSVPVVFTRGRTTRAASWPGPWPRRSSRTWATARRLRCRPTGSTWPWRPRRPR